MTTTSLPPTVAPRPSVRRPGPPGRPRSVPPRRPAPSPKKLLHGWLSGTPRATRPGPAPTRSAALTGACLSILAALLFGLLAHLTVIGTLEHNRDQQVAYDDLRLALAEGTAPVGPLAGQPLASGTPLARLTIPAIGLKEVVLEGTSAGALRSGVGHRRDTVYPGQAGTSIVMGRRMTFGGPFSQLSTLVAGDEIRVETGQGQTTYRVVALREAGDPIPAAAVARLTLITTAGSRFAPTDLFRVDADLVGTAFPAASPAFTPQNLPAAERALKGDPGGLAGAVGWGMLLCAAAVAITWLRLRWGRWQSWLIAVPTLGFLGLSVADHVAQLLPNLL